MTQTTTQTPASVTGVAPHRYTDLVKITANRYMKRDNVTVELEYVPAQVFVDGDGVVVQIPSRVTIRTWNGNVDAKPAGKYSKGRHDTTEVGAHPGVNTEILHSKLAHVANEQIADDLIAAVLNKVTW